MFRLLFCVGLFQTAYAMEIAGPSIETYTLVETYIRDKDLLNNQLKVTEHCEMLRKILREIQAVNEHSNVFRNSHTTAPNPLFMRTGGSFFLKSYKSKEGKEYVSELCTPFGQIKLAPFQIKKLEKRITFINASDQVRIYMVSDRKVLTIWPAVLRKDNSIYEIININSSPEEVSICKNLYSFIDMEDPFPDFLKERISKLINFKSPL